MAEKSSFEIRRRTGKNPYTPMTEDEMFNKLKMSREQGRFKDAEDIVSDIRVKYKLSN